MRSPLYSRLNALIAVTARAPTARMRNHNAQRSVLARSSPKSGIVSAATARPCSQAATTNAVPAAMPSKTPVVSHILTCRKTLRTCDNGGGMAPSMSI